MDKATMLSYDVGHGLELIKALEAAKLKVIVALWMFMSEYGDWRLVLSARELDALDLRAAYRSLNSRLDAAGFTPWNTPVIVILRMTDPFIKDLRKLYGKYKEIEGTRIGSQMIGGRFVEDAFVYRIS